MRRLLFVLSAFFLVVGFGFASGQSESSSSSGKAQIELFWESGQGTNYLRDEISKIIGIFEKAHPNITVVDNPFVKSGTGQGATYETKLLARLSAGKGPDLFTVGDDKIFQYAENKLLAPVPSDLASYLTNNFPTALKDGMVRVLGWKGVLYGAPWTADWVSLFYNKDDFTAAGLDPSNPPSNLADLQSYAEKLTVRSGGRITRSGISLRATTGGAGQTDKWINFLTAKGGDLFNADTTKTVVNSKEGIDALTYFVDLIHKYKVDALDLQPRDSHGFAQNTTAMFGRGSWVIPFLKDAAPNLNYGVGIFPGKSEPFVDGICVGAKSGNAKAAWTFISWLMHDTKVFGEYEQVRGAPPLLKGVADMPYFQNNKQLEVFAQQPLWPVPQNDKFEEAKSVLGDYLEKAAYQKLTPKEALDQAASKMDAALAGK